jgi:hypothetical protein
VIEPVFLRRIHGILLLLLLFLVLLFLLFILILLFILPTRFRVGLVLQVFRTATYHTPLPYRLWFMDLVAG